jgi:hypothetical protein
MAEKPSAEDFSLEEDDMFEDFETDGVYDFARRASR